GMSRACSMSGVLGRSTGHAPTLSGRMSMVVGMVMAMSASLLIVVPMVACVSLLLVRIVQSGHSVGMSLPAYTNTALSNLPTTHSLLQNTSKPMDTPTDTPTPVCDLRWRAVNSPSPSSTTNYLFGVAAVSPNDVWAVGTFN